MILPPADRDAGFAPGAITDANRPFNLIDGHDVIEGNAEDDIVAGDNAFVDRYTGAAGAWLTMAGPGAGPFPATDRPNSEPARAAYTATDMVRRDVTTRTVKESAGAFGNDYVRGGGGKDDVYGLLGNDWLEGNEDEDAIVGDMGKIVDNQLGGPTPDTVADPPLNRFVAPPQPFLGSTLDYAGMLKREVTLYAFDESQPATAGIGHDVVLGGDANDAIHTALARTSSTATPATTGSGSATTSRRRSPPRARHRALRRTIGSTPAGAGAGHDHIWGGYGADYLDVRPRSSDRDARHRTDERPGDLVPGRRRRGVAQRRRLRPGELPGDRLPLRRLGSGHDAGQRGRQRPEARRPPARLGRRLQRYYLCPSTYGDWVSTRAVAPGSDRVPAVDVAGLRRDDDRHRPAPPASARLRSSSRASRARTRTRSTRTRPRTSRAGRAPSFREACASRALAAALLLVAAGGCGGDDDVTTGANRRAPVESTVDRDDDGGSRRRGGRDAPRAAGGPGPLGAAGRRRLHALAGEDRRRRAARDRSRSRALARRGLAAGTQAGRRGRGGEAADGGRHGRAGDAPRPQPVASSSAHSRSYRAALRHRRRGRGQGRALRRGCGGDRGAHHRARRRRHGVRRLLRAADAGRRR